VNSSPESDEKKTFPGGEFTNRCLDSILNRSSNKLRNDFLAARPRSKQRNRGLESLYSPIVSLLILRIGQATNSLHTRLFDTYVETLLKTLLEFSEFLPRNRCFTLTADEPLCYPFEFGAAQPCRPLSRTACPVIYRRVEPGERKQCSVTVLPKVGPTLLVCDCCCLSLDEDVSEFAPVQSGLHPPQISLLRRVDAHSTHHVRQGKPMIYSANK
jgi:hypothetical protein